MGILNWESETPVQGPALPPPAVCSRQSLLFSRPRLSSAQQGVRHQDVRGSCAVSGHRGIEELRGQVRGNIEKGVGPLGLLIPLHLEHQSSLVDPT